VQAIDLFVIGWLVTAAAIGLRRGLTAQVVALVGFGVGALLGSRIAPALLSGGGESSAWQPVIALAGAVIGGLLVQALAAPIATSLQRKLLFGPIRSIDRIGGLIAGLALGLLATWMLAVAALYQPELGMRRIVQRSALLPTIVHALPQDTLMNALQRIDPLPILPGFSGSSPPAPDPALTGRPAVTSSTGSVLMVEGTACGLGIQGSGWVVRPGILATNAHVVAGEQDTAVEFNGRSLPATVVFVSAGEDIALLRVPGLTAKPLQPSHVRGAAHVVLVGYPGGGPLVRAPGGAGSPVTLLAPDAYGHGIGPRTTVPLRGPLRHGMSGGPVLDARGRVLAMMFAATRDGNGGFAVPVNEVLDALGHVHHEPVSTGPCAG